MNEYHIFVTNCNLIIDYTAMNNTLMLTNLTTGQTYMTGNFFSLWNHQVVKLNFNNLIINEHTVFTGLVTAVSSIVIYEDDMGEAYSGINETVKIGETDLTVFLAENLGKGMILTVTTDG